MGFQAYPLFFIGNILNLELKDDEFPILDLSNLESCYHNNTKDNMFTYYFDQPEIIEEDIVKTSSNFYFPNAFLYSSFVLFCFFHPVILLLFFRPFQIYIYNQYLP